MVLPSRSAIDFDQRQLGTGQEFVLWSLSNREEIMQTSSDRMQLF